MDKCQDLNKSTVSIVESSDERQKRKSFFKNNAFLTIGDSSCDADISTIDCERDLTPGSLDVWVDLPDAIKFDPALAPFKQMYEQQHGKQPITPETPEGDRNIFNRKIPDSPENPEIERQLHNKDVEIRLVEPMAPDDDKKKPTTRKKQLDRTLRVIKLSVLVACWVLLTVSLLMNREKTDIVLHTAVNEGEVKEYFLKSTDDNFKVAISLTGPFAESLTNESTSLQLWLHRSTKYKDEDDQDSSVWLVNLQPDEDIDFSPSASDVNTLILENPEWHKHKKVNKTELSDNLLKDGRNETQIFLRMSSTSNRTVPLTVSYQLNPLSEEDGLIYSTLLLATLYILIIFEVVNRTLAALLSSSLGVAALSLVGERPSLPELVSWLDVETLLLLFSMMLLVAIVAETGLFDYLAVVAFEVTGGRTWPLINCLCFFTAFFSTFLDNVTTVLLMTPVTIRLCEVMQLNPVPVLMSMVIFSNVGGSATPVGDPPNVIIASHPSILGANINFTSFTLHMGLGILCVCVQTYLQLRYMYRDVTTLRHSVPRDIVELRQEIGVWKRAAASLSSYSRDEDIVRRALEKKVARLQGTLGRREAGGGARDALFCSTLAQMKTKYRIRDKQLLIKSGICITFVVVVFFLHAIPELQRLSLGWTALLGALLLLLLAEREDLEPVLARVEWSTLLFFAALFVMMEVLSKLGLISWIGRLTESLISKVGEESRLAVAIMLILWVSGLASAFVDNIPLTTMMVRVVAALADGALNLPLAPLAWALSFGACLGERLSLGWTALLGALLLLLLAEREDLEPVLARVEWSTLLFFAALFVMMEVLSKLGLISWIGRLTESLISKVGEESRLAVAIMLILWVSGLASAFVDNIPLTTMMVRVVAALADGALNLPLAPLAWALSFGACLGGNGTLIGASANVVCAGVAEQHGYRFTFMQFFKIGFPVMIGNLLVASVYLLFCHCVFTWH